MQSLFHSFEQKHGLYLSPRLILASKGERDDRPVLASVLPDPNSNMHFIEQTNLAPEEQVAGACKRRIFILSKGCEGPISF